MPAKEMMIWNVREQRWHKRYRGKSYAISPRKLGCPCSRSASRDAANDWWSAKQVQIDATIFETNADGIEVNAVANFAQQRLTDAKQSRDGYRYTTWLPIATALQNRAQDHESIPVEGIDKALQTIEALQLSGDELQKLVEEMLRSAMAVASGVSSTEPWKKQPRAETDVPTIREAVESFLSYKRTAAKQVTTETLIGLKRDLYKLRNVLCATEPDRLITTIDEAAIDEILLFSANERDQRTKAKQKQKAPKSTLHFYKAIRQFIAWLYRRHRNYVIPRNLPDLTVKLNSPGKQPTFSPSQIKDILAKLDELAAAFEQDWQQRVEKNSKRCPSLRRKMVPPRNGAKFLKLCILLMLNTGSLQKDLSDLAQSEVDWEEGRITRERSKMQHHESARTVCYKLWPETFRLLKEFRSSNPIRALLNSDGGPLKTTREEDGRIVKADNLKSLLSRFEKRLNWPAKRTWKSLRKTGSTQLQTLTDNSDLKDTYLAHAPANVRTKHYQHDCPESQAQFDAVLAKLGAVFGQ